MVAQTNHQTTKYATENKWHCDLLTNGENLHGKNPHRVIFRSSLSKLQNKWHGDLLTNGENLHSKTPLDDFQVTISETPLLS